MPVSSSLYISFTAAVAATAAFTYWNQHRNDSDSAKQEEQGLQVTRRDLLPRDLDTWRMPKNRGQCIRQWNQTWDTLAQTLYDSGYTLWEQRGDLLLVSPGYPRKPEVQPELRKSYGFGYVHPVRNRDYINSSGSLRGICRMQYRNGLYRAASSHAGADVVVRVLAIKEQGEDHLDILRKIATGPNSFWSNNHTLPMLDEIHFEDITLGVFPKIGQSMSDAYGPGWSKNSVGDVIDMIMQMIEALEFIHGLNIAHRDAFQDNFLVQWHSDSMLTKTISSTRPRVYLIDFEVAVHFPQEYEMRQCVVSGLPLGGSFANAKIEDYSRPKAPECLTGELYSPFKLDVWQLGWQSLRYFKSGISSIDNVLEDMTEPSSAARLGASAVLDKLRQVVYAIPPEYLLFDPKEAGDV